MTTYMKPAPVRPLKERLVFSAHSRERMALRGISEDAVREAIRNPDYSFTFERDHENTYCKGTVRVVLLEKPGLQRRVITVANTEEPWN